MRRMGIGSFSSVGARTDYPRIICAARKQNANSTHTSFRNAVCGGVWSGGPSCRVSSSVFWGRQREEGANAVTDTSSKPDNAAEGDDGNKGRHRYLGVLGVPRKPI